MRQRERKARSLDRDGYVIPVADGVFRVMDPEETSVFTVTNWRCDCGLKACAHTLAVMAWQNRNQIAV